MAFSQKDLEAASQLFDELPGLKQVINRADELDDNQLENLLHLVEAGAEAMRQPEGSERQTEIVNGLIEIDNNIQAKIQESEEGEK